MTKRMSKAIQQQKELLESLGYICVVDGCIIKVKGVIKPSNITVYIAFTGGANTPK